LETIFKTTNQMKKEKRFRKGQIVRCGSTVILVTGQGKKDVGYPVFAGVVIMAVKRDDDKPWPVGMYSNTWSIEAFKQVYIRLSELIANELNN
jgi:hypothetical protein